MKSINHNIDIWRCIVRATAERSLLSQQILNLQGMSSRKCRHLLNNLTREATGYLEVGVWKGSTFISACYRNDTPAYACDNFSEFHGTWNGFKENVTNCMPCRKFEFCNGNFNNVITTDKIPNSSIDLFFYDGGHSEVDHYNSIINSYRMLKNSFVLVVDDWNCPEARYGTERGILKTGLKIERIWELPAKDNGDLELWWNGVGVFDVRK